jgi:hypothetical protein
VPLWLTPTLLGRRSAGLIKERWRLSGRPEQPMAPETGASPDLNVPLWLTPTLLGRRATGLISERCSSSGRP